LRKRVLKMATNNNGNLLDSAGNVVVDFVWGNFPLQPNDVRPDTATGRLDFALDNHVIAQVGWNGYPLYVPNTDGSAVDSDSPADGIQADEIFLNIALNSAVTGTVALVVGQTTALAVDSLKDNGFLAANITTASGAANAAKSITRVNVTSTTAANVYTTTASTAYPVGTKVVIAAGTGIPAGVVGTWTVTNATSTYITIAGTGFTVADSGTISPAATLTGLAGTVKSIAFGSGTIANQTTASTVTVTPFATAS
jgi:hypothetical protein